MTAECNCGTITRDSRGYTGRFSSPRLLIGASVIELAEILRPKGGRAEDGRKGD